MLRAILCSVSLLALGLGGPAAAAEKKEETTPLKKSATKEGKRRPSDVVFLLIEMSDADEESVAELQRLYDVLRKLDKNKDGKIDPAELKVVREQLIDERVERIVKKLDADNDGKISADEAKGRIKEHFERLDANKDGFVSREELRQAISARAGASGTDAPPRKKASEDSDRD